MNTTRTAPVTSVSPSLETLRAIADALWVQDHQAFGRYVDTDTESVETPAFMHDAPIEEFISFHPAFGLAEMRRQRWERIHALSMAAAERTRAQPALPGVDMDARTYAREAA